MSKRVYYEVLEDEDPDSLAAKVNKYLEHGWTLQGGVAMAADDKRNYFAQAVVRDIEQELDHA